MLAMKTRVYFYLDGPTLTRLDVVAAKRDTPRGVVVSDAVAAMLREDGAQDLATAFGHRLDRVSLALARIEREQALAFEMLALFVRYYLNQLTPAPDQATAQARGKERFVAFMELLARRLARGFDTARDLEELVVERGPEVPSPPPSLKPA